MRGGLLFVEEGLSVCNKLNNTPLVRTVYDKLNSEALERLQTHPQHLLRFLPGNCTVEFINILALPRIQNIVSVGKLNKFYTTYRSKICSHMNGSIIHICCAIICDHPSQ